MGFRVSDTFLAQAGPPGWVGRGTKPCKLCGFSLPSSLRRGPPGREGGARNHVITMGFRYVPRSGEASLEG
eukprot:5984677-Pyramimonas_sp.AAC.1